jgi:hypothetical protein
MKTKLNNMATTWTHFALGLILVAEASFIFFGMRFVMPACKRILNFADANAHGPYSFIPGGSDLLGLMHTMAYQPGWWLIAIAIAWALFEWRVRGQNKQWVRLSVLTSTALLLFATITMFSALLVIPTVKAAEQLNARHPEPVVAERIATLDRLLVRLDDALAKNDLATADDLAHTAAGAASELAQTGAAASTLLTSSDPSKVEAVRTQLDVMASTMREVWFAAKTRHPEPIEPALKKFREAYAQVKSGTVASAK